VSCLPQDVPTGGVFITEDGLFSDALLFINANGDIGGTGNRMIFYSVDELGFSLTGAPSGWCRMPVAEALATAAPARSGLPSVAESRKFSVEGAKHFVDDTADQ
jgi:hypothetical protein